MVQTARHVIWPAWALSLPPDICISYLWLISLASDLFYLFFSSLQIRVHISRYGLRSCAGLLLYSVKINVPGNALTPYKRLQNKIIEIK
jgi:hypothetical protein